LLAERRDLDDGTFWIGCARAENKPDPHSY
jgi:hypothetical protein